MSITARKSSLKTEPPSVAPNEERYKISFTKNTKKLFSVEDVIISDEKSPVALLNVNENNNNTQKRSDRRQVKVSEN